MPGCAGEGVSLLIAPDHARRLARIIAVLGEGERLAARVSAAQARLARDPRMRQVLAAQAAQEAGHARLAEFLERALPSPVIPATPALAALRTLERQIERDLEAGDLAASVIGMQGVVEHLGETVLERLDPMRHGIPFLVPIHRKVLAQERAHVAFGRRWLATLGAPVRGDALASYVGLGGAVYTSVCELLDIPLALPAFEARVRCWAHAAEIR